MPELDCGHPRRPQSLYAILRNPGDATYIYSDPRVTAFILFRIGIQICWNGLQPY
jgi:hypothetical protein